MIVLLKPRVIYDSKVTIRWDIDLDRPTLFEKTILKRGGVKIFETSDISMTEYTDREISEGDASYVAEIHLNIIGEDGSKIDFSDSSEYIYDNMLLEVSDGILRFKGLEEVTDTTIATNMIFGNDVEVSDGRLQLKDV